MATTAHAAVDCDPLLFRLPDFPSVIPIKPSPAMSPSDAEGMTGWVTINGERLPAMVVGGEPRIPIALLHNRPLNEHAYSEIERMMEDLNIHKSLATPCQMNSLRQMDPDVGKMSGSTSLNLVTRSDAERICGIIRNESTLVSKCDIDVDEAERLSVEHHMFGRVCGWVYPSRKGGRCARCQTCHKWFTPQDFVAHSHKENKENQRTVHWGFDPVNNWQLMVQLVQPSAELPEHQARWKEFLDNSPLKNSKAVKRTADDVQNVPVKVAREMDDVCKGSSDVARPLLEAFLREQCGRLFGLPQAAASLAELLHKEHSFRVKAMADSGRGVVPANPGPSASSDQPAPSATAFQILASTVADPFSFPTPEENGRSFDLLRTRLVEVEAMLNRVPSDPTGEIRNAIRELRLISQQLDPQMALYHRLRASYDYLFTLWRQATDPIGSLQDPLMRNVIAYLQADQAVAGAVMEAQAQARAQAQVQAQAQAGVFRGRLMMDLSQQHLALKVAAMNQYQLSTAGQLAPTASLPVRVTPMGPPLSADQALQQQRFIANQLAQMLSRTAQQPPL